MHKKKISHMILQTMSYPLRKQKRKRREKPSLRLRVRKEVKGRNLL